MKYEGKNGGIVYIDVNEYSGNLRKYGEYHKNKDRTYSRTRKARILFIDDVTAAERLQDNK